MDLSAILRRRISKGDWKLSMPAGSVQCRTLQKALAVVGSVEALGKILAVPTADLERWLAGSEDPPMPVFLNLVDFLLEQSAPRNGSEDK